METSTITVGYPTQNKDELAGDLLILIKKKLSEIPKENLITLVKIEFDHGPTRVEERNESVKGD